MQDFYESEVEEYEAVEDYAGPFERICYLGSGFDTTPAKTLEGKVDHIDHDPEAVEFMRRQGYSAFQEEVEEFDPEKTYDLVIISHLPSGDPLLEPNLAEDGIVACRVDGRARRLDERNDLNLQAVYEDSRQMVEKDDSEDAEEARIYLFS
jgi:hypothetical protein